MDRPHHMHIHHEFEVGQVHLGKALVAQDARIVDEDVDPTPGVHGLLHHFLHGLEIGHRSPIGDGFTPCRTDFIHDLLRSGHRAPHAMHIAAQVVDDHFGAT